MDLLAQLVRALVCGTGGRGFETHTGPKVSFIDSSRFGAFFIQKIEKEMKNKDLLVIAALSAMFAVVLGAFGAHGLKKLVTVEQLEVFKTGVQYHFYHSVAIALVAFASQFVGAAAFRKVAWAFLIGIILFSGSLYGMTAFKALNTEGGNWLSPITPLGGLFLIVGWLGFAWIVYKND